MQQSMTPKSPDPKTQQQMQMMKFMPLIFTFFFYTAPSGLCLYWFVSTLLGMGTNTSSTGISKKFEMEGNEATC